MASGWRGCRPCRSWMRRLRAPKPRTARPDGPREPILRPHIDRRPRTSFAVAAGRCAARAESRLNIALRQGDGQASRETSMGQSSRRLFVIALAVLSLAGCNKIAAMTGGQNKVTADDMSLGNAAA